MVKKNTHWYISRLAHILQYLLSDLDKPDENDENEHVAKDANSSGNDEDDFECEVTDVG